MTTDPDPAALAAVLEAALRGDGLRWVNTSWGLIHAESRGRTYFVRQYAKDKPFAAAYADPGDGPNEGRGELGSGPLVHCLALCEADAARRGRRPT